MLLTATSSLVLVAFLIPLALLVKTSATERATAAATADAQALAPSLITADRAELESLVTEANAQSSYPITVFLGDGTVLGPAAPRSAAVQTALAGSSLTADAPGGREVLVAVAGLPGGTAVVRAFVPQAALWRGVVSAWIVLCCLGLGLLAMSGFVADRLSRTITRPLSAVAAVSDRLAGGDLQVRAIPGGPPEVRRVGTGLNHLAARIGELLKHERESAADLSHRLRTPLTALRIDAEGLGDPGERARIGADLDALERTVDDIIRVARRPADPDHPQSCDAATVVRDRTDFWSALADEEGRTLRVRLDPGPITVRASVDDLEACLDALLGNVFTHTPEGTPFLVRLSAPNGDGLARLVVADRGPGMPAAPHQRGRSGVGSTGLGLDIARRIATSSGGDLSVTETPGGGTTVIVLLRHHYVGT
jgi:signal transduction histidine kinase